MHICILFALLPVIFNHFYAHPPPATANLRHMSRIPQRRFGRRAPVRRFSRTCSAPPPPPSNRTEGLRAAGAVTCRVRCRRQGRVRWECGEWRRRERPFPTKIGTLALAVARKGEIHVEFNNKAASRTKIDRVRRTNVGCCAGCNGGIGVSDYARIFDVGGRTCDHVDAQSNLAVSYTTSGMPGIPFF